MTECPIDKRLNDLIEAIALSHTTIWNAIAYQLFDELDMKLNHHHAITCEYVEFCIEHAKHSELANSLPLLIQKNETFSQAIRNERNNIQGMFKNINHIKEYLIQS